MADYAITNVARRVVYTGSAGVGPYAFTFPVLINTDIAVYKNTTLLTLTTDYTVTISGTTGQGSITLVSAATGADRITIVGARSIERSTDFVTGGDFFANTLNTELDSEVIFVQQIAETAERSIKAPVTDPTSIDMTLPVNTTRANKFLSFNSTGNPQTLDAIGTYKGNWATSTAYVLQDIVKDTSNNNIYICITAHTSTGSQPISSNADVAKWSLVVDSASASTSATNAASSASAASTSATNAAASASTASTQASNASTSASNASTSATNAASSASAASTSATNAASSYDAFDDRYLGAKASAPSVDNDGNALLTGSLYWDTVANQLYVWTGSAWNAAAFNASGAVTSFQTSLSGLTPSTSSTGSITLGGTLGTANGGTGSTSTTYVNLASNVTGTLPVANGGTGASTLTANNVLLGNGTSSPTFVAPGTNGNVLQSNGTTWTSATIATPSTAGGTTTQSGSFTLTSASTTVHYVTPTTTGQICTLPDATTIASAGTSIFKIYNNSQYYFKINDSTGTTVSYVAPFSNVACNLISKATAAGTWTFDGGLFVGIEAIRFFNFPDAAAGISGQLQICTLTSTKELIIIPTTTKVYGIVYDSSTQTYGTTATIRTTAPATAWTYNVRGFPISDTSALVVSCSATTAFEATAISISGTTITVGTPATATLGATFNGFLANMFVSDTSSYIVCYDKATGGTSFRAITVSGLVPTIGSEVTDTATLAYSVIDLGGSAFLSIGTNGTTSLYNKPYSVSGTTITGGTQTTTTIVSAEYPRSTYLFSSGNVGILYKSSATVWSGGVVSVASNVATLSSVTLTNSTTYPQAIGYGAGGNNLICAFYNLSTAAMVYNVLTDSSGTAAAGTAISDAGVSNSGSMLLKVANINNTTNEITFANCDNYTSQSPTVTFTKVGVSSGNPVINSKSISASAGAIYNFIFTNQIFSPITPLYQNGYVGGFLNLTKGSLIPLLTWSAGYDFSAGGQGRAPMLQGDQVFYIDFPAQAGGYINPPISSTDTIDLSSGWTAYSGYYGSHTNAVLYKYKSLY
jgi:hypothetical protein